MTEYKCKVCRDLGVIKYYKTTVEIQYFPKNFQEIKFRMPLEDEIKYKPCPAVCEFTIYHEESS